MRVTLSSISLSDLSKHAKMRTNTNVFVRPTRLECIRFCLCLGIDVQAKNCEGRMAIVELSNKVSSYNSAFLFAGGRGRVKIMNSLELLRRRMASTSHEASDSEEEPEFIEGLKTVRELLLAKQKDIGLSSSSVVKFTSE